MEAKHRPGRSALPTLLQCLSPRALRSISPGPASHARPGWTHAPVSGRPRRGSTRPRPQRGGASGVLERPRAAGAGAGAWGCSRGSRAAPPVSGLGRRWPSFARGRGPRVLSSGGGALAGRLPLRSRVPPVGSPRSPPRASSSRGDQLVCGGAAGRRAQGAPGVAAWVTEAPGPGGPAPGPGALPRVWPDFGRPVSLLEFSRPLNTGFHT